MHFSNHLSFDTFFETWKTDVLTVCKRKVCMLVYGTTVADGYDQCTFNRRGATQWHGW
jgi:hypothetical protein